MPLNHNENYVKLKITDKIRYLGQCLAQKCKCLAQKCQCLAQKCQTNYDTEGIKSLETYLQNNLTEIQLSNRAWIRIFDPDYKEKGRHRAHPPKEFFIEVFHDVLLELFEHNECVKEVFRQNKFVFTMAGLYTEKEGNDQKWHQDVADARQPYMTIIFNFDMTGNPLGGSTVFSNCKEKEPTKEQFIRGLNKDFTVAVDEGVMFGGHVWHYGVGGMERVALIIMIKAASVTDPNIDSSMVDEYVHFDARRLSSGTWSQDTETRIRNAMMTLTQDNKRQRTHP